MLKDLVTRNRSYRRFYKDQAIAPGATNSL
jgi:hypothetical protein